MIALTTLLFYAAIASIITLALIAAFYAFGSKETREAMRDDWNRSN